jgi:hypothetical protein
MARDRRPGSQAAPAAATSVCRRERPLTGNFHRDADGLELADFRRCLRIFDWRLLIFRLRKRPHVWPKENKRPSSLIAADADQR